MYYTLFLKSEVQTTCTSLHFACTSLALRQIFLSIYLKRILKKY